MRSHRKRETHVHTGRVVFNRRIDELLDLGEIHDLIELAPDLSSAHSEDRAVEVDIFAASQLRVEPRAYLQQGAYPTLDANLALRGFRDAREELEQGAFAGAVPTNDADDLAGLDIERDVF